MLPIVVYNFIVTTFRRASTDTCLKKDLTNLTIIICILSWKEGFRNVYELSLL